MKKVWQKMNTVVLGLSKSGEAAAKYLNKQGAYCIISEKRNPKDNDNVKIKELEDLGIKVEMGENKKETILNADLIITSPGIPPNSDVIKLIRNNKIMLLSEPELAYRESSVPIIAITGTNGKTTTTSLISEIFEKAGYKAPACGNIGHPVIYEIEKNNDFLIVEISSFQLEYSPLFKPQTAVFLNYSADHVDWHGNENEYLKCKTDFIKAPRCPSWIVLNALDPVVTTLNNHCSNIYWFGSEKGDKSCFIYNNHFVIKENNNITTVLNVDEPKIIGQHNQQNIMSAISTARIAGISVDIIAKAIKEFKAVEHRLEYVDTIDNIDFYNDSKATNCDSTIWALRAFDNNKVVLIAGGKDKGTDLTELMKEIQNHASAVILIGEATSRFYDALKTIEFKTIYKENDLNSAIDRAISLKLGHVLFSPACASYDMFKNFEERGYVFKDIVYKKKTK